MSPIYISIVTAVSRRENLRIIHESISAALAGHQAEVRWILVFNEGDDDPLLLAPSRLHSERHYHGGPNKFGLIQKNYGLDRVGYGYYYLLDDDNILHPEFFEHLIPAIRANPHKRAFGFGQQRWDQWGDLKATATTMEPNKIDNSMFLVDVALIEDLRYDVTQAGIEDYFFFRRLYDKDPSAFVFLDKTLAYYNFLRRT